MSDFSEMCPLFNTGVYNELYLGTLTSSLWDVATYNFLGSVGDPDTAPSSFKFGRTVVVTEVFVRRNCQATLLTVTVCFIVGRRTGSGTATVSPFGTICFSVSASALPNLDGRWQAIGPTSFTLNTADFLDIAQTVPDTDAAMDVEFIVQYREK